MNVQEIVCKLSECSDLLDKNQLWWCDKITIDEMIDVFKNDYNIFECPLYDEDNHEMYENFYTTDECRDCFAFWDCEVGLKQALQEEQFKDYFKDIEKQLENIKVGDDSYVNGN